MQGNSWRKKWGSQLRKKSCELYHDSENSLTAPASFLEPEAFLITSIQLKFYFNWFITRTIEKPKIQISDGFIILQINTNNQIQI